MYESNMLYIWLNYYRFVAISRPNLDTLVDIANALGLSADDLLVDSLTHSASTADT